MLGWQSRCRYSNGTNNQTWTGNTLVLGGTGACVSAISTATNGFNVDTFVGTTRLRLGNVIVDGGAGTSRFASSSTASGNGTDIAGSLTINSGSEFRNISAGSAVFVGGSVVNNGTLSTLTTLQLALCAGFTCSATPTAQTISGSGTFRNLLVAPTASFTNVVFNNSNTAGVTLANNYSISGTMDLVAGIVNTGANTLTHNGAASRTAGFVVGTLSRSYTATGAYTYHVGDNIGTAEYSPLTATITTLTTNPSSLSVNVTDGDLPGAGPLQSASRYWDLTETGDLMAWGERAASRPHG